MLSNSERPSDNFYNSSRNELGVPVLVDGDLPILTGRPSSYSGLDMAVVDVSSMISPGQSPASFAATTTGDVFGLTTVVAAIATVAPDFSGTLLNSAINLSGRPLLESRVGDTLEFTVNVSNTGSDTSAATTLRSTPEAALQYVPGSLAIVTGPKAGGLTDLTGDDQAEFDAGSRTVVFRLGSKATAIAGGQLAPGTATAIQFRAIVAGPIALTGHNIAILRAQGLIGAPLETSESKAVQFSTDELLRDSFE